MNFKNAIDSISEPLRVASLVIFGLACPSSVFAAEKRFQVSVKDETGAALEDIAVGVRAHGQGSAAITDATGAALVVLEVDDSTQLAVVAVGALSLLSVDDSEKSRLARRSLSLEKVRPVELFVRMNPGAQDFNLELRYRAMVSLHGVITEQGQPPARRWEVSPPLTFFGGVSAPDGSFEIGAPMGSDALFALYRDETGGLPGRKIVVRVPAASIAPGGELGAIDISPSSGATGNITISLTGTPEQFRAVTARFDGSYWGLTLVASDGRTVMSFLAETDDRLANEPATIPVGTWYVVPGTYFCWTWTVRRTIEACLDGVDLSQSGIPRIVVTEGANLTVDIDPVAAELAIQAFFTPSP